MTTPQLVECSFLIPVRRDRHLSDGKPHSKKTWIWLRRELFDCFEGVTIAPGLYTGVYRDPDTAEPVEDRCQRFVVALPRNRLNGLRRFLAEACVEFAQKCIYLSVGGAVEFVRRRERESL